MSETVAKPAPIMLQGSTYFIFTIEQLDKALAAKPTAMQVIVREFLFSDAAREHGLRIEPKPFQVQTP